MIALTSFKMLALAFGLINAQQIYIPAEGPTARPWCSQHVPPTHPSQEPTYKFTPFAYSISETVRTATSVPSPTATSTYAPPYSSLSHLLPNISTTIWGNYDPTATATPTDTNNPYGQAAWSAIWRNADIANLTSKGLYSTTVSPTPVGTSELVLPPRDYFGPMDCYDFPEDFIFGVAGSASQIEGAATEEGKTPALMELLGGGDRANNFVANENYYYYKQDIERLASIGVKYYSFSIAWTRILPFALPGTPVNQQGIDHYNDVINFILEKGMVPLVTMFHFDTPLQFISNRSSIATPLLGYINGGYGNSTFEDAFVNYGKILLSHYADRVPYWATFNEPFLHAGSGPAIDHVIKAHARLYHFYREEINGTGKMGMKLNDNFGVPKNPKNESDVFAANWFNSLQIGTFMNPIMSGIDYPDSYKETVPDYIPLTNADLAYINGTADYLGIDPYTATVVTQPAGGTLACAKNTSHPNFPYCVDQSTLTTTGWNIGYRSYSYVYITPTYLREFLNYLWNTWKTPVFITEFGFPVFDEARKSTLSDQLFDTPRSIYYLSFMSEILKAIREDGVHVVGALAWSFADNWEFGDYDARFGMQTVNRTTQERRYKKSFFDLVDFVQARTPKRGLK